jgi:hypothetical protein
MQSEGQLSAAHSGHRLVLSPILMCYMPKSHVEYDSNVSSCVQVVTSPPPPPKQVKYPPPPPKQVKYPPPPPKKVKYPPPPPKVGHLVSCSSHCVGPWESEPDFSNPHGAQFYLLL